MTQQEKIKTDIVGKRYGRLTVVSYSHKVKRINSNGYKHYYNCICDCGNNCLAERSALGRTINSCGCLRKENIIQLNKEYSATLNGDSTSNEYKRLHQIWGAIKNRCESKLNSHYKIYGGKGVLLCDEWHDWFKFKEWALSNGYQDNLSIDRIDCKGNYEPNNCRWVTMKEQANNKSNNKYLTYKGRTQTLSQWCDELGLDYFRTKARLNTCHMTVEQAFELPKQMLRRKVAID
jgi:hypothetical protein